MCPTVLDLDTPSSYAGKLEPIVYAEKPWSVLSADFDGPRDMFQELNRRPNDVQVEFIKELRNQCEEALRKEYTHVAAYHACRTENPERYFEKGILTSSRERLEAKAQKVFAGFEGLDDAFSRIGYFDTYGGSVSLFTTAKYAPIEYLLKGSYYLRRVASELGPRGKARLERENEKTRPIFVRCEIPLPWIEVERPPEEGFIEGPYLYLYSVEIIKQLVLAQESLKHYQVSPGSLLIRRTIPPKYVKKILPPDVCIHWKESTQQRN